MVHRADAHAVRFEKLEQLGLRFQPCGIVVHEQIDAPDRVLAHDQAVGEFVNHAGRVERVERGQMSSLFVRCRFIASQENVSQKPSKT